MIVVGKIAAFFNAKIPGHHEVPNYQEQGDSCQNYPQRSQYMIFHLRCLPPLTEEYFLSITST
jgi:hypothetical protein